MSALSDEEQELVAWAKSSVPRYLHMEEAAGPVVQATARPGAAPSGDWTADLYEGYPGAPVSDLPTYIVDTADVWSSTLEVAPQGVRGLGSDGNGVTFAIHITWYEDAVTPDVIEVRDGAFFNGTDWTAAERTTGVRVVINQLSGNLTGGGEVEAALAAGSRQVRVLVPNGAVVTSAHFDAPDIAPVSRAYFMAFGGGLGQDAELWGAVAKGLHPARRRMDEVHAATYVLEAEGPWLNQHARDRGTHRQSGETDAALRARLRTPEDAVSLPAVAAAVNGALAAAGVVGTAAFLELRRDKAFMRGQRLPAGGSFDPDYGHGRGGWSDARRPVEEPDGARPLTPYRPDPGDRWG